MLSDFSVIVRRFDSAIKIACISDIHFGALEHMEREWKNFIQTVLADPNLYLILNGDLINNNTRSSVGSPWDDVIRPREQKKQMVELLTPIKDRILCCTSGNHERRSMKDADDDPTYDIMTKLDIEDVYRQNAAFLKIQLGQRSSEPNKGNCTYTFAVTHGSGGGIYTGATVNRNERWGNVIEGLDCLVVGHTHKGTVSRPSKIVFDPSTVIGLPSLALLWGKRAAWVGRGHYNVNSHSRGDADNNTHENNNQERCYSQPGVEPSLGA